MYNSGICPILDYCSEVCGFKQFKHIEAIQHKSKDIEGLFTKLGLPDKFINWQQVFINSVWALLHEDLCKNWEDNIKMKPTLRTYIKFKNVLMLNHMFCHLWADGIDQI